MRGRKKGKNKTKANPPLPFSLNDIDICFQKTYDGLDLGDNFNDTLPHTDHMEPSAGSGAGGQLEDEGGQDDQVRGVILA